MGSTAAARPGKIESAATGWLCLATIAASIVAAAVLQLRFVLPNHDSVWLLVAAERLLSGGTYSQDFVELNPPLALLLHVPAIMLKPMAGNDSHAAFVILVLGYATASLYLLTQVLDRGLAGNSDLQRWLPVICAACLLLLPHYDFGQREHLLAIFVMPYLAMQATDLARTRGNDLPAAAVSAWACLGMFLKPVFLLLPMLFALDRCARARSVKPLLDADIAMIGLAGLAYAALVIFLFPDYFTVARYALEFYGAYSNDLGGVLLVVSPHAAAGIAVALFAARLSQVREERRLFTVMALAAGVAVLSVVIQQKGWSYHVLPVRIFTGISMLLMVAGIGRHILRRPAGRGLALFARTAPFLAGALFLLPGNADWGPTNRQGLSRTAIYSALQPVASGKRLFAFSSSVKVGMRWTAAVGAGWGSRFSALWLVPGYLEAEAQGRLPAARLEEVGADIRRMVEEDFIRYRPEVVIVDRRADKQALALPFEFLEFFKESPRFIEIWGGYSFHRNVDGLDIYLLSLKHDGRRQAAAMPVHN